MKPTSAVSSPEACKAARQAPQQKTQAKPTKAPKQKVLVTGGGGYLGFSLGSTLAKSGASVILLDLRRPQWELSSGTEFIQADVRDEEALYRAFEGVDCVFHVASYGMSGAEKLQKEQIESINVGGTKLVIDVCVRQRVPRLVYTSTVNVAFGGKPIDQGDEDSVPYFPLDKHMDHYSRTKAIADQLILMANGTPLPGGGTLRTCVLRPPGIYGPEEQRHLPRVASHIKRRLFMFRFGDRRTRMNWVHVLNLVQAHVLAAEALTAAKGYVAGGQAYYINDGESVNLFEWMAPLFEKLGYSQPWIQVPTSWVYLTAAVMEHVHLALRPICSIPPLLTRSEVCSVTVTHTFQIAKARAQLGYTPDKFSFADAVERYVQSSTRRPRGSTARALLRLLQQKSSGGKFICHQFSCSTQHFSRGPEALLTRRLWPGPPCALDLDTVLSRRRAGTQRQSSRSGPPASARAQRPQRRLRKRRRPPGGGRVSARQPSPAPAPAPARPLLPQPSASATPGRLRPGTHARSPRAAAAPARLAVACARVPSTRPRIPGSFQRPRAPPAPWERSIRPARPLLRPRSAGPRAPLAAPRHSRGARSPCTLERRAASLCQLLWILAAVAGSWSAVGLDLVDRAEEGGGASPLVVKLTGLSVCFCKMGEVMQINGDVIGERIASGSSEGPPPGAAPPPGTQRVGAALPSRPLQGPKPHSSPGPPN
ncbi:putative short-chain dehydrogenase/reductase family 42E member 2 [Carlito syrichta]|uniref:Short-chain dehydrogenase/reductase family 42E member 2 n=1 Tax=Carlito syrichta TaxID=1868482 RepID=A0A3Q0E4X4_CARSF|nr:putative short-chain dehydrogenase/reductase family 42E member 2 [Carlito syrichta]